MQAEVYVINIKKEKKRILKKKNGTKEIALIRSHGLSHA